MVVRIEPVVSRQQILDADSGQTRYADLLAELDAPESELDRVLMELAKDGELSLLAIGESLSIRAED